MIFSSLCRSLVFGFMHVTILDHADRLSKLFARIC